MLLRQQHTPIVSNTQNNPKEQNDAIKKGTRIKLRGCVCVDVVGDL